MPTEFHFLFDFGAENAFFFNFWPFIFLAKKDVHIFGVFYFSVEM